MPGGTGESAAGPSGDRAVGWQRPAGSPVPDRSALARDGRDPRRDPSAGPPPCAPAYIVSYVPSGTLFAWLEEHDLDQQGRPSPPRLLALGDPVPQPAAPIPNLPTTACSSSALRRARLPSRLASSGVMSCSTTPESKWRPAGDLDKKIQAVDSNAGRVAVSVWRGRRDPRQDRPPGSVGSHSQHPVARQGDSRPA